MSRKILKLYKVVVDIPPSVMGANYNYAYVVAYSMEEAAKIYRKFLDDENIGFFRDRTVMCVDLIAEADRYPECNRLLFVTEEKKNGCATD